MRFTLYSVIPLILAAFWLLADRYLLSPPTPQPFEPLEVRNGTIVLGTRTWPFPFPDGPDSKDKITFERTYALIPWPTPFHGLLTLGASSPNWSRHVYDKLTWTKPDGSVHEIVWRDEQKLRPSGWMDEYNNKVEWVRTTTP